MSDDGKGTYIVLGASEMSTPQAWDELVTVAARSAEAAIREAAAKYDGYAVYWAVPRRSARKMTARIETTRRVIVEEAQ